MQRPHGSLFFGNVPSFHLASPISSVPLVPTPNNNNSSSSSGSGSGSGSGSSTNLTTEYLVAVTGLFSNGQPVPTSDPTVPLTAVIDFGSTYLYAENEFNQYALFFSAVKLFNVSYWSRPSYNPFFWTGTPQAYFCNQTLEHSQFWEGFFKGTSIIEGVVPAGGTLTIELNNSTNVTMSATNIFSENDMIISNRGLGICGAFCNLPKVRECTRSVIGLPLLWGNVVVLGQDASNVGFAKGNDSVCQGSYEPITTTTTTTVTTTTRTTRTTTTHRTVTSTTHTSTTTTTTTTTTTMHVAETDKHASTWDMKKTLAVVFSCIGGVLLLAGVLVICARPRKTPTSYNPSSSFQTPYASMDDDDEY